MIYEPKKGNALNNEMLIQEYALRLVILANRVVITQTYGNSNNLLMFYMIIYESFVLR